MSNVQNIEEPSWQTVDRIIRKRHGGGSDWGSERIVLVRQIRDGKMKELFWWRSHKAWSGRMSGYQHVAGKLMTISYKGLYDGPGMSDWKEIQEGGRLSRAMIARHRDAIDTFFGEPVADQIEVKRTLVKSDKAG